MYIPIKYQFLGIRFGVITHKKKRENHHCSLSQMYNRQNELYIFSKRTIHFSEKKACYVLCEKEQMKSSSALFFNRVSSAFSKKARHANLKRELHDV